MNRDQSSILDLEKIQDLILRTHLKFDAFKKLLTMNRYKFLLYFRRLISDLALTDDVLVLLTEEEISSVLKAEKWIFDERLSFDVAKKMSATQMDNFSNLMHVLDDYVLLSLKSKKLTGVFLKLAACQDTPDEHLLAAYALRPDTDKSTLEQMRVNISTEIEILSSDIVSLSEYRAKAFEAVLPLFHCYVDKLKIRFNEIIQAIKTVPEDDEACGHRLGL